MSFRNNTLVAALACAALSACGGGGGGGGSSPSAQTAAPAAKQSVLIEEYGDSTTYGLQIFNGVPSRTPNNEPAVLQTLLQQQFGAAVSVSNQGVDGSEASQLLNGTDKNHAPWAAQMAASKADIVTINFMRNDAAYYGEGTPGEVLESPADYYSDMKQLVDIAKANGKQVVLLEPDPTSFADGNDALERYLPQLKALASAERVPLVFDWEYAQGLANYGSLLSDGVHPDDALYADNAQWEAQVIAPMVQALLR